MKPNLRITVCIERAVYFGGLITVIVAWLLCPMWVGRTYTQSNIDIHVEAPGKWLAMGAFGLTEANSSYERRPLWDPPTPYRDDVATSIRWPWQRPSQRYHLELSLSHLGALLSYSFLGLGILLRCLAFVGHANRPELVVSVAWAIAIANVIGWLCIYLLLSFAGGFGQTGVMPLSILSVVVVLGLVSGLVSWWYCSKKVALQTNETKPHGQSDREDSLSRLVWPGFGLLCFTLGLFVSVVILAIAELIVSSIHGPVTHQWGSPGYPLPPRSFLVATGVGTMVAGWVISLVIFRLFARRALPLGVIVGSTLLGVIYSLRI